MDVIEWAPKSVDVQVVCLKFCESTDELTQTLTTLGNCDMKIHYLPKEEM